MLKLWRWYQRCLTVHPVKTQVISSGFLWGFGDVTAQYITHSTAKPRLLRLTDTNKDVVDRDAEFKVNWKRVAITSMFGFGFVGPVGHFWYEGLDKFMKLKLRYAPKTTRFVAAKVAMDGLIFGPVDLLVFFTYMGFATGKNTSEVKEGIKRDFLPALALEGGAWPLLQIANFRYVPVQYQLLYVNIFCLVDSAFLSWVEQQKDAAWKQWFTSFQPLKERGGQGRV
ncbi:Peroxisomal membrane protein PMP22 [Cardamine amara subsp. amara]|uniref:Peroxisomal membrane protein PMP22 n=1 Tax=Cardamine amara subsp. amara TaxID=228776 RepID=A0ABD0ZT19_CARAN